PRLIRWMPPRFHLLVKLLSPAVCSRFELHILESGLSSQDPSVDPLFPLLGESELHSAMLFSQPHLHLRVHGLSICCGAWCQTRWRGHLTNWRSRRHPTAHLFHALNLRPVPSGSS